MRAESNLSSGNYSWLSVKYNVPPDPSRVAYRIRMSVKAWISPQRMCAPNQRGLL